MNDNYQVWGVVKLKGGIRGTTTAVFLATALAKLGHEVLLIDADKTAQSAVDWALRVEAKGQEQPFDVAQWTPERGILSQFVRKAAAARPNCRYVIIDVEPEISKVEQAAAVSTLAVLPTGVDPMELARVVETDAAVRNISPRIPRSVLLTRVPKAGAQDDGGNVVYFGRSKNARASMKPYGMQVLSTEIPQDRERYADVFGHLVTDLGAYGDLVDELVDVAGSTGSHRAQ